MLPKSKKTLSFIFLLCYIMVLSGCWDRRDIEQNGFILGIGIDAAEDEKIEVTYEIALPQSASGGGGEESSGGAESALDVSVIADDIADANTSLLSKVNRYPIFTHLQLLVFGEEYAKEGIHDVMDFFFRNPDIRYRTDVAVALGQAKKILEFEPKTTKAASTYISRIIEQNSKDNFHIFQFQNIGRIYQNYIRKSPIFLSQVSIEKDVLDVTGGGVFKNYKLVGWFSGEDVQGLRWGWGEVIRGGDLRIEMPENKGGKITLSVFRSDSSLIPVLEDDNIIAKSKIYIEGDITSIESHNVDQKVDELFFEWEKAFEDYIRKNVHNTFIKSRDVFGVDNFEIDGKMADYYPEYWEENKENWDEIFKTVELTVDVDVKIRRVGIVQP